MKLKLKLIIYVLLTLLSTNMYSQTSDSLEFKDYVEKAIKDSTSNFYYPSLLKKTINQASDLSVEDCYYLYYGQIFQKNKNVLSFIANPERLDFDKAVKAGNCKQVYELGTTILARNPFDLTVLLHTCNCIKEKELQDNLFFVQRFENTLNAIFSTGDGKSMETAIRIVNMEDDYVLKGILGFLGGKEKLSFENNHAYSIWENKNQKLYFEDVMQIEN